MKSSAPLLFGERCKMADVKLALAEGRSKQEQGDGFCGVCRA